MLSELRIKDYLLVLLIIGAVGIMSNLDRLINKKITKPNPNDYSLNVRAKVVNKSPIRRKQESLVGSNLKQIGYDLLLEYKIGLEEFQTQAQILYSQYNNKGKVDFLLNFKESDSIGILVKTENKENLILDIE